MVTQSSESTYLGVGLYSIPEAARIIGTPPSTLRSWVKSYTSTVRGKEIIRKPVIPRALGSNQPVLTFIELMELLSVKGFREAGVSMATIRKAAQRGIGRLNTPYPFASHRFETDGKHIFAALQNEEDGHTNFEDIVRSQQAMEQVIIPLFHRFDFRTNHLIGAFWPRTKQGRIVLNPFRSFGKPLDAETGVPTAALYDARRANQSETLERIAWWFDVPLAAVEAAVEYEQSLQRAA